MVKIRASFFRILLLLGIVLVIAISWRVHNARRFTASIAAPVEASSAGSLNSGNVDLCSHVYQVICHTQGESQDPTGSVRPDIEGEKLATELYQKIVREHPHWTPAQIDESLVNQIYTPKERTRIQAAYRWVLGAMERYFEKLPDFSPDEKRRIRSRLRSTELQLPPPSSIYADEPDLFTKNAVYYERTLQGHLRLRVGGAFVFISKSWFNLVFTMAHELAHAVDPCEIRAARLSFPAYDHLIACFLENKLVAVRKTRSECGENDQLSEVFSDWIAVQITAEALSHFATEFDPPQILSAVRNSVRDLCEQEDQSELAFNLHPTPEVRIDIFSGNAKIRELLGCPSSSEAATTCSFSWTKIMRDP